MCFLYLAKLIVTLAALLCAIHGLMCPPCKCFHKKLIAWKLDKVLYIIILFAAISVLAGMFFPGILPKFLMLNK